MSRDPGGKDSKVRRFARYVLLGLGAAVAFHLLMRRLGLHWPWTTFLYIAPARFGDWDYSVAQAASGHPYFHSGTPALAAYFPGAYLIFGWFGRLSDLGNISIYLGIGLLAVALAVLHAAVKRQRSTEPRRYLEIPLLLVACVGSYPVLFALDRGNLDLLICGLCTLFVATDGGRFSGAGALALAIAIAAKGYPAAFLLLPLARRDYRSIAWCMAGAAALTLLGLVGMQGGIEHNLAGLRENLGLFHERYVLGDASLFASSDPYNAIRLIASGALRASSSAGLDPDALRSVSIGVLAVYRPLSVLFALVSAGFILAVPAPAWRRVTAVCLIAILFPNVASDYKLCCLIPGLVLLLLNESDSRREVAAFWLFYLLMIPKSYYYLNGRSISMLINPLLLLGLAALVLADRAAWREAWRLLPGRRSTYLAPVRSSRGSEPDPEDLGPQDSR
jgi:hypothetical protein